MDEPKTLEQRLAATLTPGGVGSFLIARGWRIAPGDAGRDVPEHGGRFDVFSRPMGDGRTDYTAVPLDADDPTALLAVVAAQAVRDGATIAQVAREFGVDPDPSPGR